MLALAGLSQILFLKTGYPLNGRVHMNMGSQYCAFRESFQDLSHEECR